MLTIDKIGGMLSSKHAEFFGTSKDDKPLKAKNNDLFIELDTLDIYYFNNGSWELGGKE